MSSLFIAGHEFHSRLFFTGTGKYASAGAMMDSLTASESELVTLSLRRMDLKNQTDNILQPFTAASHKTAAQYLWCSYRKRSGLCRRTCQRSIANQLGEVRNSSRSAFT